MRGILALVSAGLLIASPSAVTAQEVTPAEVEAREALDAYGRCVSERRPVESLRVLTQDFRSATYRTGLQMLSRDAERNCARSTVGRSKKMRSANLLFAGSVAENLLEANGEPLNARLARASGAQTEVFAPTDAVAQCLARSLPDDVALLFATSPGSAEEAVAITPLFEAVPLCSKEAKTSARIELSVPALRAMTATAALRLIASSENANA